MANERLGGTTAERLQAKLVRDEATGCLNFYARGAKSATRGTIRRGRQRKIASRVAWELANGPIPEGMVICHRCDNPPCCNPDHLFLGTQAENMADMRAKGRDSKPPHPVGTAHWCAKLTPEKALAIFADKRRSGAICAQYGVAKTTVNQIRRGETWRSVTGAGQ